MRLTPQRLAICRLLAGTDEHPTAQAIHEQLRAEYPSLSLATVYNTLETLVNLACTRCHRVIDLPSLHVRALDHEVAANSGYEIMGARVMYYGLCPDCQKAE